MAAALAICAQNGWFCEGITPGMAYDILFGGVTYVDSSDPVSAYRDGSPADMVVAGVLLIPGGGEKAAGKAVVLQANKIAGNAFRDGIAAMFKRAGYEVATEVTRGRLLVGVLSTSK